MGFVQILEMTAPDIEGIQAASKEWERATEGKRTARRVVMTRDRNNPDRYLTIVFFDSYEEAMANSDLPETRELAERTRAAADAISFHDLDVIEDRS